MSAIFGIVNLNEKPVEQDDLLNMQSAMHNWAPDGKYLWHEGNAGMGQMQLYNTPESVNEHYPLIDPTGNLIFVAACRIDNRDELFQKLEIDYSRRLSITDGELIFLAYQKYGKECPKMLLGDWSFAVWDKQKKELFIARDQLGITGVFYVRIGNTFIFSTDLKSILSTCGSEFSVNKIYLAQDLLSVSQTPFSTSFESVFHLDPSHFVIVNKLQFQLKKYWNLDDLISLGVQNKNDIFSEYLDLFKKSVEARTRSLQPIAVSYSGGMDSTINVNFLHKYFSNQQLYVLCYANNYHKSRYLTQLRNNIVDFEGINFSINESIDIDPIEGIKKSLDSNFHPVIAPVNQYWMYSLLEEAKSRNVKTVFNGQFGNVTMSWPKSFGKPELFASITQNFLGIKSSDLIYKMLLKYRKSSRRGDINYTYLNSTFFKANFEEIIAQESSTVKQFSNLKNNFFKKILSTMRLNGAFANSRGAFYQLNIVDPFRDLRLIELGAKCQQTAFLHNFDNRIIAKKMLRHLNVAKFSYVPEFQGYDFVSRLAMVHEKTDKVIDIAAKNPKVYEILDFEKIKSDFNEDNLQRIKMSKALNVLMFLNNVNADIN